MHVLCFKVSVCSILFPSYSRQAPVKNGTRYVDENLHSTSGMAAYHSLSVSRAYAADQRLRELLGQGLERCDH
jgi:hypothetical protein